MGAGLPEGPIRSLLVDGVIAGVGAVIVFLPQILILFFFLGLLEDTGYMARAAFIMDRIMKRVGLHGRSVVPLLSGFACAIPGIMATRTIDNQRDRLVTILVAPLMTCSARLPVYALLIGAFIPAGTSWASLGYQGLTLLALYVLAVASRSSPPGRQAFVVKGERSVFVMELPPYHLPRLRDVLWRMAERQQALPDARRNDHLRRLHRALVPGELPPGGPEAGVGDEQRPMRSPRAPWATWGSSSSP